MDISERLVHSVNEGRPVGRGWGL